MDPEDHDLTANLEGIRLSDASGEVYCTLIVEVDNSEVHVILKGLSVHEEADIRAVRARVMQFAQLLADTILSAVSLQEGGNYSVRLSNICDDTFTERELGPRFTFGHEAQTLKIENHDGINKDIVLLAFRNNWFRRAVIDYSTALKWSADAPFHCYRALEALCQHYDGDWNTMHESLGTNYCAINTLIKQHADPIRHGKDSDYELMAQIPWYALTYVRDTLLAFMIKNGATDADGRLPVLDHRRIPSHIVARHRGDCPLNEPN